MSDHPQHIRDATPGETTPISARDSATGTVVPWVGDTANAAIRVNVVAAGGGGAVTQFADGALFVPGVSIGIESLSVVDDGTVAVPAVSRFTPPRIDPTTHGTLVKVAGGSIAPAVPSHRESAVYENSHQVSFVPRTLYAITGYNSGPQQFIQVHNFVGVPSDGVTPIIVFAVNAASNFFFEAARGYAFDVGITICNSTTGPTKTIGAADCWFNVLYE